MYKKALLTGASGFLGSYIYDYLIQQYHVDTLGKNKKNTLVYDISERISTIKTMYQIVVHSAGKAHSIPKTAKEKEFFSKVNYQGTKNLCRALEGNLPKNFIYISTIAVYGKETGIDITENMLLEGKTPYAISKIKAETFLQEWSKKHKVNLVILRLPLVAGRNPKGNLQSMINGIKKGFYFNITNSNALKSIVLADDIANLINTLEDKNGIYNLSGDKDYTFQEISTIIAKQLNNKKIPSLPYFLVKSVSYFGDIFSFFPINSNKLKKMVSTLTISSKKAKKELNWNPNSLEENFKIE